MGKKSEISFPFSVKKTIKSIIFIILVSIKLIKSSSFYAICVANYALRFKL